MEINKLNSVNKEGRILYVEPNDVFGEIDGNPITPDYSDYCISFNLVVEVPSRFKSSSGTDKNNKYVISWVSSDNKESMYHVSFLQGEEAENFNFLTTYYTDIDFEDVKRKNIVEGLGIENITVSFDSYYVPTVSIKFVDVRGSSLFGREESIHVNNELTADNVFGCFFTIPYPLFRLQIKGFYGKPVTYQLTCSNFKSNFNCQTGNFEATATFIGYSYSLLTDIQLKYLAAAPYSDYYGEEYWNMRVDSPDWRLSNDERPVKLFYLINQINAAISNFGDNELITEEERRAKENYNNKKNKINNILSNYNSLINSLRKFANNGNDREILSYSIEDNINDKMLLLFNNHTNYNNDIINSHKGLIESVESYNNSFNDVISKNKLPNKKIIPVENTLINMKSIFVITDNNISLKTNEPITVNSLKNIKFNNDKTINEEIANKLYDIIRNNRSKVYEYCYLIDLYGLKNELNDRLEKINNELKTITNNINKRKRLKSREIIDITPYIGNVVKIVMCHLETLIHMFYKCNENILDSMKEGKRKPSYLGISLSNTDISGDCSQIPSWPMCYNRGSSNSDGNKESNTDNVIAWVGDFSENFEEEKLIKSIQSAIIKTEGIKDNFKNINNTVKYVVCPNDLNSNYAPFGEMFNNDLSSLSGSLGLRALKIFGTNFKGNVASKTALQIGKIDAYNYFNKINSVSMINDEILSKVSDCGLYEAVKEINECTKFGDRYGKLYTNSDKVRHLFETVPYIIDSYNSNYRHPIVLNKNNNIISCHYYHINGEKNIGLVPSIVKDFKDYNKYFKYDINDRNFKLKIYGDKYKSVKNTIYTSNTKDATNIYDRDALNNFFNENIFDILTDNNDIDNAINNYEQLGKKEINIGEYKTEISSDSLIESFWDLNNLYSNSYNECNGTFHNDILNIVDSNRNKVFTEKDFLPKNKNNFHYTDIFNDKYGKLKYDNVRYDIDKESWSSYNANKNYDDLSILTNSVFHGDSNNKSECSLFGCPFYYMQNNKIKSENYNEEINGLYNDRRNHIKCLLFLHTFEFNILKNKPNFLNVNKNSCKIEAIPYGYALLLGGYLWRKRFIDKYKIDPIIYQENGIKYYEANVSDSRGLLIDLLLFNGDKSILNFDVKTEEKELLKYYKHYVSELFFGNDDKYYYSPDYPISNKLIQLFDDFTKSDEWSNIIYHLELKRVKDTKLKEDYTASTFIEDLKIYKDKVKEIKYDLSIYGVTDYDNYNAMNPEIKNKYLYIYNNLFYGLIGNYSMIYSEGNYLQLIINNGDNIQDILRNIYTKKIIVLDGSIYSNTENKSYKDNNEISINKECYEDYLFGFCKELEYICESSNDSFKGTGKIELAENRDLLISMYMHFKNLWDKWLLSSNESDFSVKNYFGNFIFIDSFYKNIFKEIYVDVNILLEIFDERYGKSSLYNFLGDIASQTHCLFLSMPDYICLGDDDEIEAIDNMESIFKPIPYNEMNGIEKNNKFIFIYTHKPSENVSEQNNYKIDSFDLWTNGQITEKAKKLFSDNDINNSKDQINRYGYNVPSFGIAFSKQNNHLFKSIKLDMNNPIETEQSIKTLVNIAQIGSGNSNKVSFVGQDVYPIFSNYSYMCEVEMMGDAQIMPLMYFQLMNIPMWRGTYMIYNVNHVLTPGNMTTTFKGMKMSSNSVPYSRDWYIGSSSDEDNGIIYDTSEKEDGEIDNKPIIYDNDLEDNYKKSEAKIDYWEKYKNEKPVKPYFETNEGINDRLIKLYNNLFEEINNLDENKNSSDKWNVILQHVIDKSSSDIGILQDHKDGIAMDLGIANFNNGNISINSDNQKKLLKVFDILYCNHRKEIRQCVIIYNEAKHMNRSSNTRYKIPSLHVSVNTDNKVSKNQFFIASIDNNYLRINDGIKDNRWFLDNAPIEFVNTAKRLYGNKNFQKTFINYGFYRKDMENELNRHFGKFIGDIKRNNPGNIKSNNIDWKGKVGESGGFVIFDTIVNGTRAMMININTIVKRKIETEGVKKDVTISHLITKWAPESDGNNTKAYINFVCSNMKVESDTKIPLLINGEDFYKKLTNSMCIQEHSKSLSEECLTEAYNLAKDTILKADKKRDIKYLIVHCTASPYGKDYTAEQIRNYHVKNNGWSDIGYHYVVRLDGTIEKGRDENLIGAHVKYHNSDSIGIVYVGGLDKNGKPADTRTDKQKKSIVRLLTELKAKYPKAVIRGHRDFSPDSNGDGLIEPYEWIKSCPCFDATNEYKDI